MSFTNTLFTAGGLAGVLLSGGTRLRAQTAAADSLLLAERAVSDASARGGFAAAIVAALAEDGAILWPGAPVIHGPGPVRGLLSAQRLLDSLRITWQPLTVQVSSDGTLGATWGVAAAARDGVPARIGRYIAAWRREHGEWKLAAFVGLGIYPLAASTVTADMGPITLPALPASGPAARFIAADLDFARLAGDSTAALAFERFAAPEAVTLGGGLLTSGPAAIRRSLEGRPPSQWSWHPVLAGAAASGELGFTVG
ncbi:MAG TPA: hypothetical protein VFU23_15725, partial [Gemmatimonadales bacterium]|nr:hypothetical protein [Gemmatimonadales bacterium]